MSREIWKTIPGYPNYQASNKGKIRRMKYKVQSTIGEYIVPAQVLKPCVNSPYLDVNFDNAQHAIHRLVAETFIPHTDLQCVVIHIDGDFLNNEVSNLKWISRKECSKYNYSIGKIEKPPTYKGKKVRCINSNEVFSSIKSASESLKISAESISTSAYSNRPVKGLSFEFVV